MRPTTSLDDFDIRTTSVYETRDVLRIIVDEMYKTLVFTHVDTKEKYLIYAARIHNLLGTGGQYVLLFVDGTCYKDFQNQSLYKRQNYISRLPWKNLQTRTMHGENAYKLKKQKWVCEFRNLNDLDLNLVFRDKEKTMYFDPQEFYEVSLLHNMKKNSKYQHSKMKSLTSALTSFNCLITKMGNFF